MLWRKLFGLDVIYNRSTLTGVLFPSAALLALLIIFFAFSVFIPRSFFFAGALPETVSTAIKTVLPLAIVGFLKKEAVFLAAQTEVAKLRRLKS